MKINLNLLPYKIDQVVNFPSELYENTDILGLKDIYVKGSIYYNVVDEIEIDLQVDGIILLKDAISNEEVNYPISIKINENLAEIADESAKYLEKNQNILDIIEFLWENIVLEVPIRYTTVKDAKLKGEGWELNNNDADEGVDPRMQKLSEIFKGGE